MIQSFIYKSENNNTYIYDDQHRLSMLVHPEFEKAIEKNPDTDVFYLKKYAYLMNHGFFVNPKLPNFRALEEHTVRENIINAKQVVFECTDSCNLSCTYCAYGKIYEGFDVRTGEKINTNNAIKLLKYIFDLQPKNKNKKLYISFYGGEPLLNMDFIKKIVEISNQFNEEKELQLEFSMTTNATLIHKYIDFLYAHKFHLLISLDGDKKNNSYRVFSKNNKNSFWKVIENLDMIKRDYSEYFSSHVNLNAVLHNRNSVKEIYEFIYYRYNKIPRIGELNMREINPDYKDTLKSMFQSKWKSEEEYLEKSSLYHITHSELSSYKELTDFLKYYSINYYISNINALLHIVEKYLPTSTCTPFSKKIFLTNRNKLLPCERINYKYSIGIVNENVELNIPEITRKYNFYFENLKKYCQTCYAYRFCGSCLFYLKNVDNVDKDDFVCYNYFDQNAFKYKLNHIFSFLERYPNDFSEILEHIITE